jgi:hypothetical protein
MPEALALIPHQKRKDKKKTSPQNPVLVTYNDNILSSGIPDQFSGS